MTNVTFSVFTKPWKMPITELGKFVSGLGFTGIELPVRPGYPVTPENAAHELPRAANFLAGYGVAITSIAGPTDEAAMAACREAGVPIIRICVGYNQDETYTQGEARLQREFDALVPLLDKHQAQLGAQNHFGARDICNAAGLARLVGKYDPKHIAAVWDAGHNGLEGEQPESALDIVWPHLCMVNLKSAYWRRTNGPEAPEAHWEAYWTTGRHGHAHWPRVAAELRRRAYTGVVCLTAEYTDEHAVDLLIAEDIAYARSLFETSKE